MAKKLTRKQKGFIEEYVKTGNGTQAALNNYDTNDEHTAASIAYENLRKPEIVSLLEEAFPDRELFQLHNEGLHNDDLSVRHRYLDTAYKLKGSYAPEKKKIEGNLDIGDNSRFDALIERIEAELDDPERTAISP